MSCAMTNRQANIYLVYYNGIIIIFNILLFTSFIYASFNSCFSLKPYGF